MGTQLLIVTGGLMTVRVEMTMLVMTARVVIVARLQAMEGGLQGKMAKPPRQRGADHRVRSPSDPELDHAPSCRLILPLENQYHADGNAL